MQAQHPPLQPGRNDGTAYTVGWDSPVSRGRTSSNRILANDYHHSPSDLPFKVLFWGRARWKPGDFWEREGNTFFGVELVLGGDMAVVQNDKEYLVETGDVFLLQPGARHRYSTGPSGFTEKMFAGFGGTLIDAYLTRTGLGAYDVIRVDRPGELLRRLRQFERPLSGARDQKRLSVLAYGFLLDLAGLVSVPYPPAVRDALAFIRQNLDRELTNSEIAGAARASVPHLSRLFRKSLNTSPVRYHIHERMARARIQLRYTGRSVKEIAQAMGYDDPLYFSKRFRKYAGVSPRHYRGKAEA